MPLLSGSFICLFGSCALICLLGSAVSRFNCTLFYKFFTELVTYLTDATATHHYELSQFNTTVQTGIIEPYINDVTWPLNSHIHQIEETRFITRSYSQ